MTPEELKALRDEIAQRFRSGNSIPVERAVITAEEWGYICTLLDQCIHQQEEIERLRDILGMPGKPVSAVIADLCRDDPEFAARYQAAAHEAQGEPVATYIKIHKSDDGEKFVRVIEGGKWKYDVNIECISGEDNRIGPFFTAPPPPSVPDGLIKMVATTFFRYWYNAPGSNTDQGFDDWWSDNREAMLNAAKQEGE